MVEEKAGKGLFFLYLYLYLCLQCKKKQGTRYSEMKL